jgi:hypothetical protein
VVVHVSRACVYVTPVSCRAQMAPVLQAADVLVMNKSALLEEATRVNVCPQLNASQLHRLLTLYTPDEYDPEAVHPGVLLQMAALARNNTQPLQRRAAAVRLDTRLGTLVYDVAAAATRVPDSLKSRAGFAFLLQPPRNARLAPAKIATALNDEPW